MGLVRSFESCWRGDVLGNWGGRTLNGCRSSPFYLFLVWGVFIEVKDSTLLLRLLNMYKLLSKMILSHTLTSEYSSPNILKYLFIWYKYSFLWLIMSSFSSEHQPLGSTLGSYATNAANLIAKATNFQKQSQLTRTSINSLQIQA